MQSDQSVTMKTLPRQDDGGKLSDSRFLCCCCCACGCLFLRWDHFSAVLLFPWIRNSRGVRERGASGWGWGWGPVCAVGVRMTAFLAEHSVSTVIGVTLFPQL